MPGHGRNATQRSIPLIGTTTDQAGKLVVQGNVQLGRMNNRLYRQCRNYSVRMQYAVGSSEANRKNLYFYTLPDTWFVHGAVHHAYETYMQMMSDELAQGVKMARWHDFSINEQNPDGTWDYAGGVLYDGDGHATLSSDETITDSSVTDSGGTSKGFHLIGNLNNSYNIFREFAKKLNYSVPDDESVSSDQPYDGLLDLDDADVLAERGDRAPYDRDFSTFLPDDTTVDDTQGQNILVLQDSLTIEPDASQGRLLTRTFNAPLGLVWVESVENGSLTDLDTSFPELIMHFTKGDYKGVKAPSMV